MISFDFYKECYGCRNCENICPYNAISMVEDNEGFLMPKIDKLKCKNCGLCEKFCPKLNCSEFGKIEKKLWLGAYNKNNTILKSSTSGGFFWTFADFVLKNNGYVCGCILDENLNAKHIVTNDKNVILKMQGSKYMQSNLGDVLKKCKELLLDKKMILFTGTPCQIAAAKLFLRQEEKVIYLGLVCEGAGSNKVWQKYKKELEKKYHSKLVNVDFRNKEICWDSPVIKFEFANGKILKNLSYSFDYYMRGFLSGIYNRKSCYNCQYKGNYHNADLIIGDLWGCSKELRNGSNSLGCSLVIINTEKGKKYFNKIKINLNYKKLNPEFYIPYNESIVKPLVIHKNRQKFYNNLEKISFKKNIIENLYSPKVNIKLYLKNILYKVKLYKIFKLMKYKSNFSRKG